MGLLELRRDLGQQLVGLLLRDDAFLDQPCGELLANRRVAGDLRGHQGLRVRRLVLLVVTVASIADEVDDDVAPKRRLNASASRTAEIAASGSSALTWMIGTSKPFARSLE